MDVEERISQYTKKSRFNQLIFEWLSKTNSNKCISLYCFERVEKILDDIMEKEAQFTHFKVNYINRDAYEIIIIIDENPTHLINKKDDLCLPLLYVNFSYYNDTFPELAEMLAESLPNLGYDSKFADISRYVLDTMENEMMEADRVIEDYELLDINDLKCTTIEEAQETLEDVINKSNLIYERIKKNKDRLSQYVEKTEELYNRIESLEVELARKDETINDLTLKIKNLEEKLKIESLPEELSTPKMLIYWERLQENEIVDKNYQPVGNPPGSKLAYIAHCFFEAMNINNRWILFESFWRVSNLAQAIKKVGYQSWKKSIDEVFEKKDEMKALKTKIKKLR